MDYTIHGILQARKLEWVAFPFYPGDLPNPGIEPRSPTLQADSLPAEPQGEPSDGKADLSSPVQDTWPLPASDVGFFILDWSVADLQCFCSFQVDSKLIQVYIYTYLFFFRFFSPRLLQSIEKIPCAVPEVLVYLLYI